MYAVEFGYLYVSTIENANQGDILVKADINLERVTPLVVNDYGIFVVNADVYEAQVSWFTHEGELVKIPCSKGNLSKHIYGKLLFYLKPKKIGEISGSAYWIDMEIGEEPINYQASSLSDRISMSMEQKVARKG